VLLLNNEAESSAESRAKAVNFVEKLLAGGRGFFFVVESNKAEMMKTYNHALL
jgi:hypothetical protein